MSSLYWYGVTQQYMSSINSKENSMSTTFNPYAFVASAALRNTKKEIIMMTVSPHWTELQTSHTRTYGWNKSCWCFKALYYRLLYGQTLSVAFWIGDGSAYSGKCFHAGLFFTWRSEVSAVLQMSSSDTSENWLKEVWPGGCLKLPLFYT